MPTSTSCLGLTTSCSIGRTKIRCLTGSYESSTHLNCSRAQNIPLFRPMVASVELMASTFPWAVHNTGDAQTRHTQSQCTAPQNSPPKTAPQNPGSGGSGGSAVVTCSSEADEHGGGVEAPDAGLDEHGDVRAGDQTDTTSATTERTTRLNPVTRLSPAFTVQQGQTRLPH